MVYHSLKEDLERQGVIFLSPDQALQEHPDLLREYFGTIIPPEDNKFAALNTAVWSGGSFVYVPPGVTVDVPLQAYFRINSENMGQFERTLIIVDEGAQVHYVEGCTAPTYSSESLHSAVVEIICKPGLAGALHHHPKLGGQRLQPRHQARRCPQGSHHGVGGRQSGQQADHEIPLRVHARRGGARGNSVDRPLPASASTRTPAARSCTAPPHTSSIVTSKSISKDGGRSSYRGLVKVANGAKGARSKVVCDALILDKASRSDTYPVMEIDEADVSIAHEASVSRIQEEQLFYLMSRGLSETEASTMIVNGFIEPLVKELPMEYAVEMNRLIELQMEGSVG